MAFAGVFAATLLGFLAIGAVLPVLPRYVRGPVGAGDVAVGIVIGAFALTAVVSRPIGGRMADAGGRRRVVVLGLLISAVAGALLFVRGGVAWLVVARLVLGIGDGWLFTAGVTWIVDLAPEERRGQAIGLFGLAIWGGLTFGSVIGEALYRLGSFDAVWAFAALAPLAGMLIARRVPDAHAPVAGPAGGRRLLPRPAIRPGVALALATAGYGTIAGFVVLHLDDAGIGHGATVFTAFAASVVITRLAASGLADRAGAARTALAACSAEAAGLVLIGLAPSFGVALAGGIVGGMGFALLFPSLALLVLSRVDDRARGGAMGAFTAFFDVGVGLGAPLAGAVASLADYPAAFCVAGAMAAAGGLMAALGARAGTGPARGDPACAPG
jgi:MFS family permease